MLAHPAEWKKYYRGNEKEQQLLRVYSYSDRIRYYWRFPEALASVTTLIDNLRKTVINETLLSQYCPLQYAAIRRGDLQRDPKEVVIAGIRGVLKVYSEACLGNTSTLEARKLGIESRSIAEAMMVGLRWPAHPSGS